MEYTISSEKSKPREARNVKKWVKALLCTVLAVVLLVGGYVAYVCRPGSRTP